MENRVLVDMRWRGTHGIGRFAEELFQRIPGMTPLQTRIALFNPLDPILLSFQLSKTTARVFFTPGFNAPLRSKVPVVLTVHDLNYVHFQQNSDPLRRAYFQHVVRPACRRAYRVLTVSEFSRRQIIEWANVDDRVVTNVGAGVDRKFSPSGSRYDPGYPYMLAIGSDKAHKNICGLIEAFDLSGLATQMKLVVSGRLDRKSNALLRTKRIRSAVQAIGTVAERDLPSLYRGAVALCMPSMFEGFGLPMIEAMASGVPVLASTRTALPEVAGNAAVLVDPGDVESIASGLREVALNTELRKELIARGLSRIQSFSWENTARTVQEVLLEASR